MLSAFPSLRRSMLAVTLLSSIGTASAADEPERLDAVVVTATRTPQTQDETLAAITVIDRAEIERRQATSVADLLRGMPGVTFTNNGGPGKATSLFLRGTESDHVLVLIDGVKVGSATSGGPSLQDLPLEQIERIEIVRGPFSSLYGSEALGGVIQIFTRRPAGAFSPFASASVGSDGYWSSSVGAGGRGEHGWASVMLSHQETDGINAYRGRSNFDPDLDGYRNNAASVQGGMRYGKVEADAHMLRAEGHVFYDGFYNESFNTSQVVGGRVRHTPVDALALTLNLGRSQDLSDNFGRTASSKFDTHRKQASLQADIKAGEGLVTLGYDWQRDEVASTTRYALAERSNRGAFVQWQQAFGQHALQASLRRDDNEQFGGETTGAAMWGWDFTETLRLTASYGAAFKAPTFNELYFPSYGNPALVPETSRNIELGVHGRHGWGGWSFNVFDNRIEHLIGYDPDLRTPELRFGGANNIDQARIRGLEASADAMLAEWNLRGSVTLLDPRNDSDDAYHDNILPRRARQSGRFDADRSFGAFSIGGSVYAAGERFDEQANRTRMAGYATADLRLEYKIADRWRLQAAATNVFDRNYETAAYYNQPGRGYTLTLRYQPAY